MFLDDTGSLIDGGWRTIKNEAKEQNVRFLSMLLGKLGAGSLGNLLTGKGVKANILGWRVIRAGEGLPATSQGHEANLLGKIFNVASSFN